MDATPTNYNFERITVFLLKYLSIKLTHKKSVSGTNLNF